MNRVEVLRQNGKMMIQHVDGHCVLGLITLTGESKSALLAALFDEAGAVKMRAHSCCDICDKCEVCVKYCKC